MIRVALAKTAVEQMRATLTPEEAARASLARMWSKTEGTGGAILVAKDGSLGLARTTRTMSWAAVHDGEPYSGS